MQLTEKPEIVQWPASDYVFVEKIGSFQNTAAQAWKELHRLAPEVSEHSKITGHFSLYKLEQKIYRAGVSLASAPVNLPEGLQYMKFQGGKYSRFVLTGPYSNLPEASGRVFKIVSRMNLQLRDEFTIEHYVNDPKVTPEQDLITEILIPTA